MATAVFGLVAYLLVVTIVEVTYQAKNPSWKRTVIMALASTSGIAAVAVIGYIMVAY